MSERAPFGMRDATKTSHESISNAEREPESVIAKGTNVYIRQESGPTAGMPLSGSVAGELATDVLVGRRIYLDGFTTEPVTKIITDSPRPGWVRVATANDAVYVLAPQESPETTNEMADQREALASVHDALEQQEREKPVGFFARLRKVTQEQWKKIVSRPEAESHRDFIEEVQKQPSADPIRFMGRPTSSPQPAFGRKGGSVESSPAEGESIYPMGQHVRIEQTAPAHTGTHKRLLEFTLQGPVLSGVFVGRPIYLDGFTTEPILEVKKDTSRPERTYITTKDGAQYAVYTLDPRSENGARNRYALPIQTESPQPKRGWFSWWK